MTFGNNEVGVDSLFSVLQPLDLPLPLIRYQNPPVILSKIILTSSPPFVPACRDLCVRILSSFSPFPSVSFCSILFSM